MRAGSAALDGAEELPWRFAGDGAELADEMRLVGVARVERRARQVGAGRGAALTLTPGRAGTALAPRPRCARVDDCEDSCRSLRPRSANSDVESKGVAR